MSKATQYYSRVRSIPCASVATKRLEWVGGLCKYCEMAVGTHIRLMGGEALPWVELPYFSSLWKCTAVMDVHQGQFLPTAIEFSPHVCLFQTWSSCKVWRPSSKWHWSCWATTRNSLNSVKALRKWWSSSRQHCPAWASYRWNASSIRSVTSRGL